MVSFCKAFQEELRQRNNVFPAFPQGREDDMDGVDAVVQVFAETAFPYQLFQVHVGGADKPDIHRDGLGAAHAHHAPALNHPQQLGLQVQRDIADFVQEECSAVGLFKLAGVVCMGVRKGAFDVAEEFASVMAPASTATIGFPLRRLWKWISRARTSLPVPFSPVMSTVASVGAILSMVLRMAAMGLELPQNMDSSLRPE